MPAIPEDHFIYTIEEWNKYPLNKIIDFLPPKIEVFYDIGANAGGFSSMIKNKYSDVKIYCFEPFKKTFGFLEQKLPYAKCINKAVYYGKDKGKLLWRGGNIGAIYLEYVNSGNDNIDTGEIAELTTLEELSIDKPDLIKIDIEGAEDNLIEKSEIIKNTEYLIIEWHHDSINPVNFLLKNLPNHRILLNIESRQFLLILKQI